MQEKLVEICVNLLNKTEVKDELKNLLKPLIDMILIDIYPYLYISLFFIAISFILHLGIFLLLLR